MALVSITFGVMFPHDPIFIAPPPTEVPDYVLYQQYEDSYHLPGSPSKQPRDTSRWIPHSTAEEALQAAKRACRDKPGRWYGRSTTGKENVAFLVYADGKIVEHHVVDR